MPQFRTASNFYDAVQWDGQKLSARPDWIADAFMAGSQAPGSLEPIGRELFFNGPTGRVWIKPGFWLVKIGGDVLAMTDAQFLTLRGLPDAA